jgi:hypothetical protein
MTPEEANVWAGIDPTVILAQIQITLAQDSRSPRGEVRSRISGDVLRATVSCRPPAGPSEGEAPRGPQQP